jgi:hypothetical protein
MEENVKIMALWDMMLNAGYYTMLTIPRDCFCGLVVRVPGC